MEEKPGELLNVSAIDLLETNLEHLYTFREPAEVIQFLENHRFLIPLLGEAHVQLKNYFGPSAQIFLEVVVDPEVEDDRELVAFVHTDLSADEAFERLRQFDRDWWLDASVEAQGALSIHVEFQ